MLTLFIKIAESKNLVILICLRKFDGLYFT